MRQLDWFQRNILHWDYHPAISQCNNKATDFLMKISKSFRFDPKIDQRYQQMHSIWKFHILQGCKRKSTWNNDSKYCNYSKNYWYNYNITSHSLPYLIHWPLFIVILVTVFVKKISTKRRPIQWRKRATKVAKGTSKFSSLITFGHKLCIEYYYHKAKFWVLQRAARRARNLGLPSLRPVRDTFIIT